MKTKLFLLHVILLSNLIVSSAQPVQVWAVYYHDTTWAYDGAAALALDASGNVYVGGWSGGVPDPNYNEWVIIKYTNSGTQLWAAKYDGSSGLDDKIYAMTVDTTGIVFATGSIYEGIGGWNLGTGRWSAAGAFQWMNSYNGPFFAVYDQGNAIAIAPDASVYVCGVAENGAHHDLATIKYDPATGVRAWVTLYDGPGSLGEDLGRDIAVDAAGYIYVTGESQANNTQTDYVTIKYNSTGVAQWTQRYNSPDSLTDIPTGLAIDGAGNTYVTGWSIIGTSGNFDCVTVKYDAAGNEAWVRNYDTSLVDDRGYDVAVDNDGNILVAARQASTPSNSGWVVIKYNTSGDTLWSSLYVNSGFPKKIITDQNNNVYIGGTDPHPASTDDYEILKYDSAGTFQWVLIVDGASNNADQLVDFTLDNAGNIYVTGKSFDTAIAAYVILTAKYSQVAGVQENNFSENSFLNQNYPNPCSGSTKISYSLKERGPVSLKVYDMLGNEIQTLVNKNESAGNHEIIFDGKNIFAGVYYYRLAVNDFYAMKKMIVIH